MRAVTTQQLSNNSLVTLPPELTAFVNLTELNADSNSITHLPAGFAHMTSLARLSLEKNRLQCASFDSTMTGSAWQLPLTVTLQELNLRANQVRFVFKTSARLYHSVRSNSL
jgi:Leucine-rich repeat (LRR) protein